jgi:hypothetical protein
MIDEESWGIDNAMPSNKITHTLVPHIDLVELDYLKLLPATLVHPRSKRLGVGA